VSIHLEEELLTHEEISTQCGMATQEWMTTQYDLVPGDNATLKLVPKGSSDACWLETRRNSQMVLKNGMAIGPKWKATRNAFGQ